MFNFMRIGTDVLQATQVEGIVIEPGKVTINMIGCSSALTYEGDYARLAVQSISQIALPESTSVKLQFGPLFDTLALHSISWVDLNATTPDGLKCIELRLISDPAGVTHRYSDDTVAGALYEILDLLAPSPSEEHFC